MSRWSKLLRRWCTRLFTEPNVGLVHADFLLGLECIQDAQCRDDQPPPGPRFFFQIEDLARAIRGMKWVGMPDMCDPAAVPPDRRGDRAPIGIPVHGISSYEFPHAPVDLVASVVVVDERSKV